MTTFFVSRHPGALEWACRHGVLFDLCIAHIDGTEIAVGDTVIGSLPVNLAAEVCAIGACYLHLSVRLPNSLRGQELSADALDSLDASLQEYTVIAAKET